MSNAELAAFYFRSLVNRVPLPLFDESEAT